MLTNILHKTTAMRLLLLALLVAVLEINGQSTWSPRNRTVGWGEDRYAPALRIKDNDREKPARLRPEWIQWRSSAGAKRSYHNTSHEELHARIFEESEKIVAENNIAFERGETSYTLALNKFADYTEEQVDRMGGFSDDKSVRDLVTDHVDSTNNKDADGCDLVRDGRTLPEWNWKDYIDFNPARDQGEDCSSCYAFAAIATIEAQIQITLHKKYSLSEQYAMDCSRNDGNQRGCGGGLSSRVYEWFFENDRGFALASSYGYSGRSSDDCPARGAVPGFFRIKCYRRIETMNETLLRNYVIEMGPIATAIYAGEDFHLYNSGVYASENCNGLKVNHEIVTIGYGNDYNNNMMPYWIIRNSRGPNWGMNGYMWLKRDVNMCGFPMHISYPKILACSPNSVCDLPPN